MSKAGSDSGKSSRSFSKKLRESVSLSHSKPPAPQPPSSRGPRPLGRDPALSTYINARAFGKPEGASFQEQFRALFDSINGDKAGRQQLYGVLLRFFFYEELPPDLITQLAPLLKGQGKDAKVLRALLYLLEVYVGAGSAGTPTLYDPSLVGKRPDEKALAAVLSQAWDLVAAPDTDIAVKRAVFVLAAAAGRGSSSVRKELVSQVQRAITAADAAADAAGAPLGKAHAGAAKPAALDWDLQHTAFLAVRLAGAATGSDDISRSAFVGVGSADPVGARHALALVAEVAYRDAGYVARALGPLVAAAAKQYEASGPGPLAAPGQGINLEDAWARLYLARACAYVVHSDQSSGDVSRDGAPFWHMLHMLATRDAVDVVRFGAIEALSGAVPSAGNAALGAGAGAGNSSGAASKNGSGGSSFYGRSGGGGGRGGSSREDVVFQQRRGRAWRLLVAQAATPVTIPGVQGPAAGPMKLVECLGRLLMAAMRNSAGRASRFCVAANVVGSLAESCLASQSVGSTRHNTSPDCDRVMAGLAQGLSSAVEGEMAPAQRCACLEALLYLQAAGYSTGLTPARMVAAAGGGAGWAGGLQDSLLSTVLKCAKAKPKAAAAFLGYATAAVGVSPVGIDLSKVTGLWDAAAAAGKEGKAAALEAALEALQSPAPPSAQPHAGGGSDADIARAVREEDGWNAFVSTAAWWVGEHANTLCGEFAGHKLKAPVNGEGAADGAAALAAAAGRNPQLSRVLHVLQDVALTAVWQVRLAATQSIAKIAVRSGEPFRLQAYAMLAACSGSGGAGASSDPLGLQPATAPALEVLDRIYATQATLDKLWRQYGDDVEGWPDEVVRSLARRSKEVTMQVEKYVCAVPRERYALLGNRALRVMAAGKEGEEGGLLGFLSQQRSDELGQDVSGLSDRTGSELAKSKNKEIESILSYSDDGGAYGTKFASARSDISGTLDDKNKEIESLLSGGGATAADPWAPAASNSFSSFNAFLEGAAEEQPSPKFATQIGREAEETPRLGRATSSYAEASTWYGEQPTAATPAAAPAAPGVRTGVVLHMFVADYNQPEELSVFEGDPVEILEESEGWMLVKDPSGNQGLVPTSYIQLDTPAAGAAHGRQPSLSTGSHHKREPTASDLFEAPAQQQVETKQRAQRHARAGSLDYSTSKEDYLDNIFSGAQPFAAVPDLPTTPEDYPLASASEDARLFGGNTSTDQETGGNSWRGHSRRRSDDWGSPNDDSWAGRTESVTASQPLRGGDSLWGRSSMDGAGTSSTPTSRAQGEVVRQGSGNPFTSAHRRTLSGTSGGSADLGSLPTTPSRAEGQERSIVAAFDAEMDGELSVAPGERVKVHSDVGGWVRVVRLSDHKSGLVPSWAVSTD